MANSRAATPSLLSTILVSWDLFVAAFLYYVLLTLLAIGVAAYAVLVVTRAVRALAALQIDLGETPHALQH
jgi:hypothetical protein